MATGLATYPDVTVIGGPSERDLESPTHVVNHKVAVEVLQRVVDRLATEIGLISQACQACHKFIDSFGFAFENFDGLGRERTEDNGFPVDTTGVYPRCGQTLRGFRGADGDLGREPVGSQLLREKPHRVRAGAFTD